MRPPQNTFGLLLTALLMSVGCIDASRRGGCDCNQSLNRVQGSGIAKTESRSLEQLTSIKLDGAADVTVNFGAERSLTITADDNILPLIDTAVRGGSLIIGSRGNYSTKTAVKIAIIMPSLDAFELNGSGAVKINALSGKSFTAHIRGSGNIVADGSIDSLSATIAGSGNLKLSNLIAKRADVTISGSGNAAVNSNQSLAASISGSGDVRYSGNPESVQSHVSGSGKVHKI